MSKKLNKTFSFPRYAIRDVDTVNSVIDIFDEISGGYIEYDTIPNLRDFQIQVVQGLNEKEPPVIYTYQD